VAPDAATTLRFRMVKTDEVRALVARALAEDLGTGDVTSGAVVGRRERARAVIIQKEPGVVSGLIAAGEAFRQCGAQLERVSVEGHWRDEVPATVARVNGSARGLLAAERTALNLLCHLSGVATLTARYADAVQGTGAAILDTRKTIPGLRALQKEAVRAGGGHNHRSGLYDAILIKENHTALAGGVGEAFTRARERHPGRPIEVECASLDEAREAIEVGARRLLLDNMEPEELNRAVAAAREAAGTERVELEASGGISLENVAQVAATGVDYISVGALTHSASALDLSMAMEEREGRIDS
jgi:nicotinate-nucleotide pyrophosphorylase (carboxylating)